MAKEYVRIFVAVPTAKLTRAIDGRVFDNPVDAQLAAIGSLSSRGVAVIGNYDNVSFTYAKGAGRYRAIPGSTANPTAGRIGEVHTEDEVVVSFTAPKSELAAVIATIRDNHPYETPGIEVFDLVHFAGDGLLP
jgi:hypothetical protein